MTDEELLEEIEREFGSHAPEKKNDSDDLDAFLADLKQAIAPDAAEEYKPKQSERDTSSPVPSPKQKKQERAPKMDPPPKAKQKKEPAPPKKAPKQPDRPQKEPSGFAKFIMRHQLPINISLLCLCLVLAAGIAAVLLYQGGSDPLGTQIMENVFVAGVDVGGMGREEALAAVNEAVGSNYTEGIMTVQLGSSSFVLAPSQTRPVLRIEGAIEEAYAYGRTGSTSQRQQDFRDAQYSPKIISLEPYLSLNTDYIRSAVSGFISGFAGEYAPSGYALEGEEPALDAEEFDSSAPCQTLVLSIGNPGSNFDLDGICNAILEGYYVNNFNVRIPSECLAEFPEELDIDAIYRQLHVDAVEAVDESTPGSCGYTFSLENARTMLDTANYGDTLSIPMEYVMPERLEFSGSFTETLSSFSTPVSAIADYNENMKLLCSQLDGLILQPGEKLSFNTSFPHTEKNGFQKAPRHGDKCADVETGGGADQVATTLYMASMTAGLSAAEKHIADHVCDYTQKGTEISVSFNWQDLKISNTLDMPVKIRAKVTSQNVVIRILSEKPLDYYVKLETKEGYTSAHGTILVNKKAADGYTTGQVLAEGADGGQVTLNWVKYDKVTNQELSRTTESVQVPARHTMVVNVTG